MDLRERIASTGTRSRAFLKCASCRFAPIYYVPYFAGLVKAGHVTAFAVIFGALFWVVQSLAIEVTNRLADRVEDEINRPERTALCNLVGWQTLRRMQVVLWLACLLLATIWMVVEGSMILAVMLTASFALGFGYSRGPRFSRSRIFAFFTLNMLFGGAFLVGWAAGDPSAGPGGSVGSQVADFAPLIVGVGTFIIALVGIKDLTDQVGDVRVGYRSPFVAIIYQRRQMAALAVSLVPFATMVLLSATLLPGRMALLAVLTPISILLVTASLRAELPGDRLLIREAFYSYWLIYASAATLAYSPDPNLLFAALAAGLFWIGATYLLHWGKGLGGADLRRLGWLAGLGNPPQSAAAPLVGG